MMDQKEFNRADMEVEQVVNANHARFCAAEQQAISSGKMPTWAEVGRRVRRRTQLKRVMNTAARLLPGLVFLAAIPKGWMHPPFACLMCLASFVWGMGYYMRGYRYE